nr:RNA-directed DNA polymerase, eukaryota, reverse transcriptase zinc-binding domain protein [Tanacetum cinerariifolium]
LYALNLALIFKWIWRFLASFSSLWIKVIKSIHGNPGALDNPFSSRLRNSTWIGILKAIYKLKAKGVDLMGFCKLVIGNGSSKRFWHDIWPPRSGIENSQLLELVQILSSISLSSASDRWSRTLHGLGEFSIKSAREEIDKHVLVVSPSHSR